MNKPGSAERFLIDEPDITGQMDQEEEQGHEALEETHMGGELGPLPDALASACLQDALAVGTRGEERFEDSHGSQHGSPEAQRGGYEEEEEVKLTCSDIILVKRRERRVAAAASRRVPRVECPTICPECGKGFTWSIHLVQHQRMRAGASAATPASSSTPASTAGSSPATAASPSCCATRNTKQGSWWRGESSMDHRKRPGAGKV